MEDDLTVVGIERGGEDGVATALDGDVKGGCVGGDGDGRGERGGEDVLGRCVLDVYHCGFLFFAKITWDIAFGKDDARGNSALPMGNGMMNVITSLPRSARKAEGFWRERRQVRTRCALAVATEESPTLSSRAEVEAFLSRLFSLWLAPSLLGLFWRGLRLWLHLLLHCCPLWGFR